MPQKIKLLFCLSVLFILPGYLSGVQETTKQVVYISANTEVNYGLTGFIKRAIKEAKQQQAEAIILGLDTFGGRVDAALEIVKHIEAAAPIPVYALVEDKAWSAGALLALSCKQISMQKGSSMGSATPVSSSGGKSEALGEKHVSAIRAKFKSIAEKNGYPANLAAAMVDKDVAVKEVLIAGEKKYLTEEEIKKLEKENQKFKITEVVIKKDKLLNLTAKQAQQYGIARHVVDNVEDLVNKLELGEMTIDKKQKNWAEYLAGIVTSSMLSGLLLMLGFFALYTEISNPGFGWAGIVGIICLGLLFWGKYIVDLAQFTEIMLFIIGVVLIFVEIFVIPGFGIAGIAGIIILALGLYLSFVPFVIPKNTWDFSLVISSLTLILISGLASAIGFFIFLHFVPEIPGLKRLVLKKEQTKEQGYTGANKEISEMLAWQGIAKTNLRPVGKAIFGEKILDVVAESEYITKDTKIKIIDVKGNRILVRKV